VLRLEQVLLARTDARAAARFHDAMKTSQPLHRSAFLGAFTAAARLVGKARLEVTSTEETDLVGLGVDWPLTEWGLDELGRVVLLLHAAETATDAALETLVEDCYRQGDNRERQAVLRSLPWLPGPDRFLAIGTDACRSHVQPVFEAIACENPYPAWHFPELNFNQLVLKALFIGVPLARIFGLDERVTSELVRMAAAYASERRAAGRAVPADIDRLTGGKGSRP
jgi:hypothetical protein